MVFLYVDGKAMTAFGVLGSFKVGECYRFDIHWFKVIPCPQPNIRPRGSPRGA